MPEQPVNPAFTEKQLEQFQLIKEADPAQYNKLLTDMKISDPLAVAAAPAQPVGTQPQAPDPAAAPTNPTVSDQLQQMAAGNPFLQNIIPAATATPADINVFDYYKTKMGVEIPQEKQNAQTIAQLIDELHALNAEKASMKEVGTKLAMVDENLSKLPSVVQSILAVALKNPSEDAVESIMRDYLDAKTTDFTKPFEKQDQLQMINRFVAADATYASLEDIPEGSLDRMTKAAKALYKVRQTEANNLPTGSPAEIIKARTEAFKTSVQTSVEGLSAMESLLTQQQRNNIITTLYDRGAGTLFNPDGTYTKEAATKLAWAEYGPQWMTQTIEQAKQAVALAKQAGIEEAITKHLFPHGEQPPRPVGTPQNIITAEAAQKFAENEAKKRLGFL